MPTKRNTIIAIAKGIAIILVVAGHAEGPEWLTNFIYEFHMPLFFMAAGFFFNRKYLSDPWPFIARRFKGLYLPFLKWSVLFLLLHNVWFHIGVLKLDRRCHTPLHIETGGRTSVDHCDSDGGLR